MHSIQARNQTEPSAFYLTTAHDLGCNNNINFDNYVGNLFQALTLSLLWGSPLTSKIVWR